MDVLYTVLGAVLVLFGLNDVFHNLLYPSGHGTLSHWVLQLVWKLSRATGHRFGSLAGPLGVVLVIVLWALVQALGWALVFYPHVPENYLYSEGLDADRYSNFAEAFYISLVTLGTLGFGDVVPAGPWLRFVAPVEALVGFALLTAALSWFSQIYPALAQRRALAARLRALREVDYAAHVAGLDPGSASRTLDGLTDDIADAHVTLVQNAETYYFREVREDASLAVSLPYALELARRAQESPRTEIRLSGGMLSAAVADFARLLREEFHSSGETPAQALDTWAADHGYDIVSARRGGPSRG
ncbi:MAG: potassium channel family protein [Actinomycetota bacterium]